MSSLRDSVANILKKFPNDTVYSYQGVTGVGGVYTVEYDRPITPLPVVVASADVGSRVNVTASSTTGFTVIVTNSLAVGEVGSKVDVIVSRQNPI